MQCLVSYMFIHLSARSAPLTWVRIGSFLAMPFLVVLGLQGISGHANNAALVEKKDRKSVV